MSGQRAQAGASGIDVQVAARRLGGGAREHALRVVERGRGTSPIGFKLIHIGTGLHLPRAEQFFDRWGWGAVVVARFLPWLRTLTPVVAGTASMSYPRFLSANVVGALGWGSGLVLVGYIAYSVPWVRHAAYGIAGLSVLATLVGPVVARVRARRRRGTPAPDR